MRYRVQKNADYSLTFNCHLTAYLALPGVAYPGVRDNRSTINTKTGYDDDDDNVFTCHDPC